MTDVRPRAGVLVTALVLLAACGAAGAETTTGRTAAVPTTVTGDVTVFAAASLTDAFTDLGAAFETAHPGTTVTFNFAGSQQLATQITTGGAPADVFASADLAQMDVVADADLPAGDPVVFARNRLAMVVEPGNPAGVTTLDDLGRDDVTVVLAAEEVPAGRYAREALDAAGVTVRPVSLETDVRAVLTKVSLGEADAGIVYTSDVAAANDRVEGVAIPDEDNVIAAYHIAALRDAPNTPAAGAFVALVRSSEGRHMLDAYGFDAP
jgi:molybdate transport system substrate-binding protein